ncbi:MULTISPECIES: hydantoinase/oxoprolinase N-terminal domain-containing protein [Actinomadura]|uniref:Hydantoinase/oxoprolinase N-terminal domain-containing protein n=1 Tax=Actinomadura yumaensis TaxID=111807 RepID=A0ABW2D0K5_9ACTN|nr:hydantoinase/oxoprolinase N-terminal domain-containing protein [Actinomadura sp. J1-007]MWK39328.1 hydantoinase [Actinomadura sp. J1-007]
MIAGIDVGPTNTDAVLLDGTGAARATAKVPSAPDDPVAAVRAALRALPRTGEPVSRAAVGLRGPARAVVERRGLARVGVLRIGGNAARAVRPLYGWPPDLVDAVHAGSAIVEGGGGFGPGDWTALDEDAVARFAAGLAGRAGAVAITGVFAPVDGAQERRAAEIVRREMGEAHVSLSGELGPLGLLERENTAVLNGALHRLAGDLADGLRAALAEAFGPDLTVLVTRGDGSVMGLDHLRRHPGLGLGSSLASTLRGAAILTGRDGAVVADVGEHRIRVGALAGGYPQQAFGARIGGVPVGFWMPDLIRVPRSGPRTRAELAEAVDRMRPSADRLPLVLVGGGAGTFAEARAHDPSHPDGTGRSNGLLEVAGGLDGVGLPGVGEVLVPEHGGVAGAIGAAASPVGGQAERVVRVDTGTDLAAVLAEVREDARASAVRAGADPRRVTVSEVSRTPLPYLPGATLRLHARASGPAHLL